jgi:aspartate racemase
VWSHAVRLDERPGTTVPIGRPIPNSVGVVLGGADQLVPVGVPGELVLGGAGIAAGYLGRPELTERSFVHLPHLGDSDRRWYRTGDLVRWTPGGDLEFLGRTDGQVKIRGHRVELGDVDAALADHDSVRGAATIVVSTDGAGRQRLIACYESNDPVDESAWRSALADRLPDYMLPSALVRLESMPQTATGKIDRRALERLAVEREDTGPVRSRGPADDLERTLITIWSGVLGRDGIGVHDDFFDLGGNSLDAMRLFARIEQTTGREMLLSTLFEAPTIAEFAVLVQQDPLAPENPSLVPIKASGFKRPFYYVAPYEVSVLELGKIGRHFDRDRPFLGLQPLGLQADEPVHTTIEEMAEHYVDAIKSHQPQGPYLIGGHCDGAWVAHEMAIRLVERGETVSQVAMTDVPPAERSMPVEHRTRRFVDRLRYYAADGRLFHAIRWQVKLRLDKLVLLRFGSAASRRVRAVRLAHEAAFDRYEFRHDHRAPIHLIRSSELAVLMDQIEWYDDLGDDEHELVVTDIASTHARLLREPETVELARVLGEGLDAVDASA